MSITSANDTQSAVVLPNKVGSPPSPWLFRFGALLSVAAILLFIAQIAWANMLVTPWYLPILGTVAAVIVLYSLSKRMRWWRAGVGFLCLMIAALEWFFLLGITVLPAYAGPQKEGRPLPVFRANLADGTEIYESYFQHDPATAVIFFQGRWCPFCVTQLKDLEAHHSDFDRIGAKVAVVSIEDLKTASRTQRDFPHLVVISDERRELSNAMELINRGYAPNGGDCDIPTMLMVDKSGIVKWLHRPTRSISRPSATELVAMIEKQIGR